jgi:hypothetical protein
MQLSYDAPAEIDQLQRQLAEVINRRTTADERSMRAEARWRSPQAAQPARRLAATLSRNCRMVLGLRPVIVS